MSKELAIKESGVSFTPEQIDLIKTSFCKGLTDDEFKIFLYTCQRTGLDPFAKQVYAVKRFDGKLQREVMTIQVGIDGFRLIADRSGKYAPGPEATFTYDSGGKLVSATASVKKLTVDGTWHTVTCTAYYDEYVQTTKDGRPMGMWAKMARTMLAKCSESLALRKAFPAELSGIYTKEEMSQAEVIEVVAETISVEQQKSFLNKISLCSIQYQDKVYEYLKESLKVDDTAQIPTSKYGMIMSRIDANLEQEKAKLELTQQEKEEVQDA